MLSECVTGCSSWGLPGHVPLRQAVMVVLVAGAVTVALRVMGAVAAGAWQRSAWLARAGSVLPVGVLTVLAAHSAAEMESWPVALVAIVATIAVHVWRGSLMWSLVVGTAVYMVGVQVLLG